MTSVRSWIGNEAELATPGTGQHPPPPVEYLEQTLPFDRLTWEDFERLCYRLAVVEGRLDRCVRFGTSGDVQGGIDLYVRLPGGELDVWQCKRRRLTPALLRAATRALMAGEWTERTRVFRIVSSSSVQNAALQREAERISCSLEKQGTEFVLIGASELSQKMRATAQSLVQEFFGPAWEARFLGRTGTQEGVALELFGRHLGQTCMALTQSSLDRLAAARLFKPELTIPRKGVDQKLSAFRQSSQTVMPLIGPSGVGKTSVLSRYASVADDRCPILLVQGCDIVSGDPDIWTLVSSLVERALGFNIPANQIATAVGRQPLLIILDALDQAGPTLSEIRRRWIPSTLDRLSASSLKLVVSCRPEYWQATSGVWRDDWLFPPPAKTGEVSENDRPPADDAPKANADRFVWIGDFDAEEAKAALRAYGFEGELEGEDVRYPFTLHAIDAVGGAVSPSDGLARIIDALLALKIQQVSARLGKPAAFDRLQCHLDNTARVMLGRSIQVIGADEARALWGSDAAALDLLSEENVLIQDAQGVRFQHDQVRERLQAKAVDPGAIFSEIVLRPKRAEYHWSDRFGLGPFRRGVWVLRDESARSKAERRLAAIPTSVASFALLDHLSPPLTPQALGMLDALEECSDPHRGDRSAVWAAQVVEGAVRRMPAPMLEQPEVFQWLVRLLARGNQMERRQKDLASAFVSALLRSRPPTATALSLVPWVLRAETNRLSISQDLKRAAHFDRYSRAGDPPGLEDLAMIASSRLVERALESNPLLVIEVLSKWIDEEWVPPKQFTMEEVWRLRRFAALCLYRTRETEVLYTIVLAIEAKGAVAEELQAALCIAKPDIVVEIVSRLSDALGPGVKPLLGELLWRASNNALAGDSRIEAVKWAAAFLGTGDGDSVWAARTVLANYRTAFELRHRKSAWAPEVLAAVEPHRSTALRAIFRNIGRETVPPIESDFADLIAVEFRRFMQIARRVIRSGASLHPMALTALLGYLSRWNLQDGRRTWPEYHEVRELLGDIWTAGDRTAQGRIGVFAITACARSGYSEQYYLQADDVIALDLLGLAVAAIDLQLPEALEAVSNMSIPAEGRIRDQMFAAIGRNAMTEECIENLAWNVAVRARTPEQVSLADLLSFRTFQRGAWDKGVLRWLNVGGDNTELRDALYSALCDFSLEEHSDVSAEFIAWRAKGATLQEAANATRNLSAYGKRDFERKLAARRLN